MIGPAINRAARITGLCHPLNQPLLVSKAFASPCDQPQEVQGLPAA